MGISTLVRVLALGALAVLGACASAVNDDATQPVQDDTSSAERQSASSPRSEGRTPPLIIAHRGASGYRPEHTLEAYKLAVEQGADFIEPDLVMTQDGVLVALHDSVLDTTTDVATRPEFADRRTSKIVSGVLFENSWFSEDFTLEELRSLRVVERLPKIRPSNRAYDGKFSVPTFVEVIELARRLESSTGRRVGIYPETKHPSYFRDLGLPMEEELAQLLHAYGYRGKDAPIFLQSFEVGNLQHLRSLTDLPIIQLLDDRGGPFDASVPDGKLSYAQMASPAGLKAIAAYADGIGPDKSMVIARDTLGALRNSRPTSLVADAHAAGLKVHVWTFRAENQYLPIDLRSDTPESLAPNKLGNFAAELRAFVDAGVDGLFVEQPDIAAALLAQQ